MMPSSSTAPVRGGHSAFVEMELNINGVVHRVAQMGGDFIILEKRVSLPPTEAELFLTIDGEMEQWRVFLPEGARSDRARTRVIRR